MFNTNWNGEEFYNNDNFSRREFVQSCSMWGVSEEQINTYSANYVPIFEDKDSTFTYPESLYM